MSRSRLMDPDGQTAIIAVASGKGGVGKSTMAANLARSLGKRGLTVGVMDADIHGFSIPRLLGIEGRPAADEDGIHPLVANGLQVMSMGFFVDETTPVIWRGPLLMKAIEQFTDDVLWSDDLDYLVIDLPPGTGDVPLSVAQRLPGASLLLITLPGPSSVNVAGRAGNMAAGTDMQLAGVVENMSYLACPGCGETIYPFGRGGGARLAAMLGVPLLAEIPMDPEGGVEKEGATLFVDTPGSAAGLAIEELTQRLIHQLQEAS